MEIMNRVDILMDAYRAGRLGGEKMPEHENPQLDKSSRENYLYFTLPMALNYQRNSYTLWECANRMYREAPEVFDPACALGMGEAALRERLVKYRVALQPNRHPATWMKLCETLHRNFDGDVRNLITENACSVEKIRAYIAANKHDFPYLGGVKIGNYWLYVLEQYAGAKFADREKITVAPDTHVIQASVRLGVISPEEAAAPGAQALTAARWEALLKGTKYAPIDLHTPMWLWSRGKFTFEIQENAHE